MKKKILTASLCAAILLSSFLEEMPLAIGAAAYESEPSAEETACLDLEYGASTLAAPTASKESGTITCSKDYAKIKLSAEKGTIYYSLNGEDYKKYTSSIKLTKNSTIKAYAQSGSTKSETVTFTYKLKPEITVDVSYAYWGRGVALDTKVSGVKIYYTTDGSKPTTSSKQLHISNYGDAVIQPSKTTKLRVLAVKSGWSSARLTENIVLGDRVVDIADPKNDFPLFKYREKLHLLTYVGVLEKEIVFPSEVDGMPVKSVATDSSGTASFYLGSIERITIPDSVTYLGDSAFSGCGSLKSLVLPDSITSIGDGAFAFCSSLKSITIPSGVTKISDKTFKGCSALKSVTLPSGVTEIGDFAFDGCRSLKSINIPDGVTHIGYYAFADCESLQNVTLPDSFKYYNYTTFSGCTCTVTYKGKKYTSKDDYQELYDAFNDAFIF